jgi:hypothetical protein
MMERLRQQLMVETPPQGVLLTQEEPMMEVLLQAPMEMATSQAPPVALMMVALMTVALRAALRAVALMTVALLPGALMMEALRSLAQATQIQSRVKATTAPPLG